MGQPTQMNENERGLFALHGITGMLLATVLLLSILAFLVTTAVGVQASQAQNFYEHKGAEKLTMNNTGANGSLTPEEAAAVWSNK